MKITEEKQMGRVTVNVAGKLKEVDTELTIITTEHDDGRVDKTVKVPRIAVKAKTKKGDS